MLSRTVKIAMEGHYMDRPVALLVQTASRFDSSIRVGSGNKMVNAKSIMGVMTLNLSDDEEMTINVDGDDEQEAMDGMVQFLHQS